MTSDQIKAWLGRTWQGRVADLYEAGGLTTKEMLLAVLYLSLNGLLIPDIRVWLSSSLAFLPFSAADYLDWETYHKKKELIGRKPDLLITHQNKLKAIMQLNFVPGGYGDFREDISLLDGLHKLRAEEGILLDINPLSGYVDPSKVYQIDQDLLLVYAVINREASMSLELGTLQNQVQDPLFWYHFYFMQGKLGNSKIKFRVLEGKS